MKRFLLFFILISAYSTTYAQFSSVSTNIVGWAAGNINAAVDLNVNLHNTISIPVSANPFKFGDTQWSHVVLHPAQLLQVRLAGSVVNSGSSFG